MFKQVNVALQILPTSKSKHPYDIVDKAIEIIKLSGIKYRVCPFETVMEGDYDTIMSIIRQIHTICLEFGADSCLSYIKIQIDKNKDVTIEDKTGKYD
jgi:uncharacterized protein (TIGR00106 family)